jgi:hypothetical protein
VIKLKTLSVDKYILVCPKHLANNYVINCIMSFFCI